MFRVPASTLRQIHRATTISSARAVTVPLRPISSESSKWGTGNSSWGNAPQTGQTDESRRGMGDQTKNPTGTDYVGGVPPASNQSMASKATEKVKQMASDAAETVEQGYEAAKNSAKKGYEAAKDTYYNMASDGSSNMKQMASDAAESAEQGFESAKQTANKGYQAAKDAAKGAYYNMKSDSKMSQAADSAEEGLENAKDSMKKGYQTAKDTAKDTYYNMKSESGNLKEMSSEAAESIEDSYENAKQIAKQGYQPQAAKDAAEYNRTFEMEHKFHLKPDMDGKYDPERY